MCAGLFGRKQEVLPGAPPVTPRVDTDTELPSAKQIDAQKPKQIAFGSETKTKDDLGVGSKQGPAALRIPLNAGGTLGGSNSGGLNV
jgi:hypothetical protein